MEINKPTTTANTPEKAPEFAFPIVGMIQTPPRIGSLDQRPQVMSFYQSGMSLRDYFAAQALPSVIAKILPDGVNTNYDLMTVSMEAYRIADNMLAERSKVKP